MNDSVKVNTEVLATQLTALASQVNKLEAKLDAYATHFITSEVYELKHRELELGLTALSVRMDTADKRQDEAEKKDTGKMWLLGTLSATAGIVLAFLVQFYLSHVNG